MGTTIAILVGYILLVIGIGVYCMRYSSTFDQFMVGNRNLGAWTVALAYFATYYSSVVLIGNAAIGYRGGMSFLFQPILPIIFVPLGLTLMGWITRKMTTQLGAVTVPDYLRERFQSPVAGLICALAIAIFIIPYMVSVVIGGAVGMEILLGLPYGWSVVIIAAITGIYLIIGGFMATIYTNSLQGIWMLIGNVWVFIVALIALGGPRGVGEKLVAQDPALLETPGAVGWDTLLLFAFVWAIAAWGMPQTVQKWFAIKSKQAAYYSAILVAVFAGIILFTSDANGVMARAHFGSQFLTNPDYALPNLIKTFLPPIAGTFLIVALVCAAMSTLDSMMQAAGAALTRDLYQRFINPKTTQKQLLYITMGVMAVLTVVILWMALNPPPALLYLAAYSASVLCATVMPTFMYGLFWKKGTAAGAIYGQLAGLVTCLLWYWLNSPFAIPPIVAGLAAGFVVFPVVSKFTPKPNSEFVENLYRSIEDDDKFENPVMADPAESQF